jgi:hypothetical protein
MTAQTAAQTWKRRIAGGLTATLLTVALVAGQARPAQASKEGRRNSIIIGAVAAAALLAYAAHKNSYDDEYDRDGYQYDAYRGGSAHKAGRRTKYRFEPQYEPPVYQQQGQQQWQGQGQNWQKPKFSPKKQQVPYQQSAPNYWQNEDPAGQWNTLYR